MGINGSENPPKVSIPLKSGLHVIIVAKSNNDDKGVSIPLKSGLHVIRVYYDYVPIRGFNPLKIGSTCNLKACLIAHNSESFNPLKIGSTCNLIGMLSQRPHIKFQSP